MLKIFWVLLIGGLTYGFRTDVGTLRPARRMADGRLRVDAHITKPGVFEYVDATYPGGVRRELREPREVFAQDALESFAQVPVTNGHPSVGMLTSDTAKSYMVGSTGDTVRQDDGHVAATLMVADAATVKRMEGGDVEVSCGYACDVDETPGEHPVFGRYDAVQRNIRGNHLAVCVGKARAGRTARVRLDSELTADELAKKINKPIEGNIKRGGAMDPDKLQEVNRALSATLRDTEKRADVAEAEAKAQKSRADSATGELDIAKKTISDLTAKVAEVGTANETVAVAKIRERCDAAEQKISRFDAVVEELVRKRTRLIVDATVVMGETFRSDDLSDRQIMAAVVKRLDASAETGASVSDDTVAGMYKALVAQNVAHARSIAHASELLAIGHKEKPRVDAREQNRKTNTEAWKQPLSNDPRAALAGGK